MQDKEINEWLDELESANERPEFFSKVENLNKSFIDKFRNSGDSKGFFFWKLYAS